MAFTLAQFRLVAAIHEHGSLGKAALVLSVTQPALSRNLRELERQVGVRLFDRVPSGLRPTPFCLAILPHAANAITEAERALEEVRILAGESMGTIRIGTAPSAAVSILPKLVGRLCEGSPGINIRVSEGVGEVLTRGLLSYDFDLIISGSHLEDEDIALALDLELEDECTILAGAGHPLAGDEEATPRDFLEQRWVTLPRTADLRKQLDRRLGEQGLPPPRALVETRSVNLVRTLVGQHGFITWGPPPLYVSHEPGREIVALGRPEFRLRIPFSVYRLRRATSSNVVRRCLAILRHLASTELREGAGKAAFCHNDPL